MPTPELQNYINQSRAAGLTDDQIRQSLVAKGWKEGDIKKSFVSKSSRSTLDKIGLISFILFGILFLPVVFMIYIFGGAFLAGTPEGAKYTFISWGIGASYPILLIWLSIVSWRRNSIWPIFILILLFALPAIMAILL